MPNCADEVPAPGRGRDGLGGHGGEGPGEQHRPWRSGRQSTAAMTATSRASRPRPRRSRVRVDPRCLLCSALIPPTSAASEAVPREIGTNRRPARPASTSMATADKRDPARPAPACLLAWLPRSGQGRCAKAPATGRAACSLPGATPPDLSCVFPPGDGRCPRAVPQGPAEGDHAEPSEAALQSAGGHRQEVGLPLSRRVRRSSACGMSW